MKRSLAALCLAALAVLASSLSAEEHAPGREVHWSYQQDGGPAGWGALTPDYRLCGEGQRQSPIDLGSAQPAASEAIELHYAPARLRIAHHEHRVDIIDNSHTIQVTYDEGSTLTSHGKTFELAQYHFHAPSEHTVNGRHYPMEMHLVHRSESGELAVLGVLIGEGARNAAFDAIWEHLPERPGEERHLENVEVDVDELLPGASRYWRYEGSLTTPPCSEGVHWLVLEQPLELSAEQIARFRKIIDANNRPPQPLHGRRILLMSAALDAVHQR
jgi:carbonic anhydrase